MWNCIGFRMGAGFLYAKGGIPDISPFPAGLFSGFSAFVCPLHSLALTDLPSGDSFFFLNIQKFICAVSSVENYVDGRFLTKNFREPLI